MAKSVTITAKLFKYEGPAAWYFLSSTKEQGGVIKHHQHTGPGWKSVPVEVRVGNTVWKTSLFPSKGGPYLLAIKASVRKKEELEEGEEVRAVCTFLA